MFGDDKRGEPLRNLVHVRAETAAVRLQFPMLRHDAFTKVAQRLISGCAERMQMQIIDVRHVFAVFKEEFDRYGTREHESGRERSGKLQRNIAACVTRFTT